MVDKPISGATTVTNLDGTEKLPLAKAASVGDYNTTTQDILNIGTITTASAAGGSNANGVDITGTAGNSDGSGTPGYVNFFGGTAGANPAANAYSYGGGFLLRGGTGGAAYASYGGNVTIHGGSPGVATAHSGGGNVVAAAGDGVVGLVPSRGGGFAVSTGTGQSASGGNFDITLGTGVPAGELTVNGDASIFSVAKSWFAGEALNGRAIYTATRAERVTAVIGRVDVVNGIASTLLVVKCASGTAPGAGTPLTSNSMDLTGTANTNQTLTLSATAAELLLAVGDSLCLVETGALGTSVGCITVHSTPQ